jgi:hypothetical protein
MLSIRFIQRWDCSRRKAFDEKYNPLTIVMENRGDVTSKPNILFLIC